MNDQENEAFGWNVSQGHCLCQQFLLWAAPISTFSVESGIASVLVNPQPRQDPHFQLVEIPHCTILSVAYIDQKSTGSQSHPPSPKYTCTHVPTDQAKHPTEAWRTSIPSQCITRCCTTRCGTGWQISDGQHQTSAETRKFFQEWGWEGEQERDRKGLLFTISHRHKTSKVHVYTGLQIYKYADIYPYNGNSRKSGESKLIG